MLFVSAIQQHESVIIVHTFPALPTSFPSHHPSLQAITERQPGLLCCSAAALQLCVLHLTVYRCWRHLSFPPALSLPHCAHKSILYICISIPSLQIDSSVSFFYIPYICIIIQCLLFWLTSLCITGSRFIHLTTTDTNLFLLMTE